MKFSKELKVGLFAAFSIAALYLGFNYLKGIDFFSTTKKYYVVYQDVNGLNVSNPVRVDGVIVGRVSGIKLSQGKRNRIFVELDINGDVILGDSTVAVLKSELLGGRYIDLDINDISNPLQKGDTLFALLDKGMEDILKEAAAATLETTIQKINTTLDNFSGSSKGVTELFEKFDETPGLINGAIWDGRRLIRGLDQTTDTVRVNLVSTMDSLKIALANINALSGSLKQLDLKETLEKTNSALTKFSETLTKVSSNEGTIGKLMNNDSLYNNLNKTMQDLDQLLIHIDENPKHFFGPLGQKKKKIDRDRKKQKQISE